MNDMFGNEYLAPACRTGTAFRAMTKEFCHDTD
jgi:hypothetical protein